MVCSEWCRCVWIAVVNHFLLLMLNQCCRHEVDEARRYQIPIIVLVDTDKQLAREVIDKYMEKGLSWLFDEQARTYSLFVFFADLIECLMAIGNRVLDHGQRVGVCAM